MVSRREFLRGGAVVALAGAAGAEAASDAPPSPTERYTYTHLTRAEAAFIEAAVARLIPKDELGPGALEAGVPEFIDRQLGGAWGAGERLYRAGPWQKGTPSQGYQLPFTPADLFRHAIRAIDAALQREHGKTFAELQPEDQDAYLGSLEKGHGDLGAVPADVFFQSLWEMTLEGYFSDPVYGGNKGMTAWAMIGFPGAYATYYDLVDRHGIAFVRKPMSLAEDGRGHVHLDPDIPAYSPERKR